MCLLCQALQETPYRHDPSHLSTALQVGWLLPLRLKQGNGGPGSTCHSAACKKLASEHGSNRSLYSLDKPDTKPESQGRGGSETRVLGQGELQIQIEWDSRSQDRAEGVRVRVRACACVFMRLV